MSIEAILRPIMRRRGDGESSVIRVGIAQQIFGECDMTPRRPRCIHSMGVIEHRRFK